MYYLKVCLVWNRLVFIGPHWTHQSSGSDGSMLEVLSFIWRKRYSGICRSYRFETSFSTIQLDDLATGGTVLMRFQLTTSMLSNRASLRLYHGTSTWSICFLLSVFLKHKYMSRKFLKLFGMLY